MTASERGILQRIFFSATLLILLARYFSHTLIHQIGRAPLLYQEIDPVYWLFMVMNLPDLIASKASVAFDFTLIASCICSIIWNKQNISTVVFFITHFVFFVLCNLMSGHHYINIGILFVSFPFVFAVKEDFAFSLTFIRFLFCFMMFSAGLWKIARGNLSFPDQIYTQLISRHLTDIIQNQTSFRLYIIKWLILHKYVAHSLWIFMIFLETTFVAGFFTFKHDRYLSIAYLLFAIGGWFLLRLIIFENLLFLLTMASIIKQIHTIRENRPKIQTSKAFEAG